MKLTLAQKQDRRGAARQQPCVRIGSVMSYSNSKHNSLLQSLLRISLYNPFRSFILSSNCAPSVTHQGTRDDDLMQRLM
jgi:hypothetical protein